MTSTPNSPTKYSVAPVSLVNGVNSSWKTTLWAP